MNTKPFTVKDQATIESLQAELAEARKRIKELEFFLKTAREDAKDKRPF